MGDIIVLCDENGNEVEFEFIDYINYGDKVYIVLIENDPTVDEIVILEVEDREDDEDENYLNVEDSDVLQAVFEIFLKNKEKGNYKEIFC